MCLVGQAVVGFWPTHPCCTADLDHRPFSLSWDGNRVPLKAPPPAEQVLCG
jgi:hypothetical protein